jgi:hypothetical protein
MGKYLKVSMNAKNDSMPTDSLIVISLFSKEVREATQLPTGFSPVLFTAQSLLTNANSRATVWKKIQMEILLLTAKETLRIVALVAPCNIVSHIALSLAMVPGENTADHGRRKVTKVTSLTSHHSAF